MLYHTMPVVLLGPTTCPQSDNTPIHPTPWRSTLNPTGALGYKCAWVNYLIGNELLLGVAAVQIFSA